MKLSPYKLINATTWKGLDQDNHISNCFQKYWKDHLEIIGEHKDNDILGGYYIDHSNPNTPQLFWGLKKEIIKYVK